MDLCQYPYTSAFRTFTHCDILWPLGIDCQVNAPGDDRK